MNSQSVIRNHQSAISNPQSLRIELALLARLLTDPSHIPSVLARLSPDDFADPMGRAIFAALADMHRKGVLIDGATLAAYLNASGIARQVGAINLDAIQEMAIPAAKIEPYVSLLQDFAAQRRYVDLGQSIIDRALAHRPGDPPLDATLPPLLQAGLPSNQPTAGRLSATALQLSTQAFAGPVWLLDRLFVAGGLNLLAGEVASGKTFLALDLALAVAAGELAWDDRPAIHGPVLYFCLDCSPRTVQQRLVALCAGRGLPPPADLHFDFSPLNLADPGGATAGLSFLRQQACTRRACLVIFDVLARYMPGVDENAVSAVGPILTGLRSFTNDSGCSILILHHYNKGVGYSLHASQGLRVRGSIDIIAAMDAVVTVTVPGFHSAPRRLITPEKNRDLPESAPMTFSISSLPDLPPTPPLRAPLQVSEAEGREGSPALRLVFAAFKPQSTAGTDLIPAVLEVLRQAPGQPFTRQEVEEALRQARVSFAPRTLHNLLPGLSRHPGVCVGKKSNAYTYRWEPQKS